LLSLESLLSSLRGRAPAGELLRQFRPPSRFATKRFDIYHPRHPSQQRTANRLAALAKDLRQTTDRGVLGALFGRASRRGPSGGVYLDGGFGVGKTHLLASFWHVSPEPRAYLSFDELMFFIGMVGSSGAAETFEGYRVLAIDEWELDDPGNLKMALAFLRGVLARGAFIAVTSNTLPLELGAGRFSQKDFRGEVEELASAFEVLRIEGEDYRHRRFEVSPGGEYFSDPGALESQLAAATSRTLAVSFPDLLRALSDVHPIRFRDLAREIDWIVVFGVDHIAGLNDALRWVHFIDSAYDAGIRFSASGSIALGGLFSGDALEGPFGKKLSRCLSRMEEMLGERRGAGEIRGSVERDGTA
jgi:cell division protein ZapE